MNGTLIDYIREVVTETARLANESETTLLEDISGHPLEKLAIMSMNATITEQLTTNGPYMDVMRSLKIAGVSTKQAAIFMSTLTYLTERRDG